VLGDAFLSGFAALLASGLAASLFDESPELDSPFDESLDSELDSDDDELSAFSRWRFFVP
jgi:hypothetical protein